MESRICLICFFPYDLNEKIPRIFPKCGHTTCFLCIRKLYNQKTKILKCPFDTQESTAETLESIPKNYGLITVLEEGKSESPNPYEPSKIDLISPYEKIQILKCFLTEKEKYLKEIKKILDQREKCLIEDVKINNRFKDVSLDDKKAVIEQVKKSFNLERKKANERMGSDSCLVKTIKTEISSLKKPKENLVRFTVRTKSVFQNLCEKFNKIPFYENQKLFVQRIEAKHYELYKSINIHNVPGRQCSYPESDSLVDETFGYFDDSLIVQNIIFSRHNPTPKP